MQHMTGVSTGDRMGLVRSAKVHPSSSSSSIYRIPNTEQIAYRLVRHPAYVVIATHYRLTTYSRRTTYYLLTTYSPPTYDSAKVHAFSANQLVMAYPPDPSLGHLSFSHDHVTLILSGSARLLLL